MCWTLDKAKKLFVIGFQFWPYLDAAKKKWNRTELRTGQSQSFDASKLDDWETARAGVYQAGLIESVNTSPPRGAWRKRFGIQQEICIARNRKESGRISWNNASLRARVCVAHMARIACVFLSWTVFADPKSNDRTWLPTGISIQLYRYSNY